MKRIHALCRVLLVSLSLSLVISAKEIPGQWTAARANEWYAQQPWLVGCNFSPSTAINQLEMWQADTFDPETIDRELGWAEQIGFTSVRVFLHHLLWEQDRAGFLQRMDQFLAIAAKHKIGVMFVPFDGVWDPFPKLGKQRDPKPHVHNSGWMQSPGVEILKDPSKHESLKPYIVGIISHFKNDQRIHMWDMFNEPDNINRPAYDKLEPTNKLDFAVTLLKKSFQWAREVNPSQPITAGVWLGDWGDPAKLSPMEKFMLDESDIITFHNYADLAEVKRCVTNLKRYHRPIVCTEFMARPRKSTFDPLLDYFQKENIGAYCWGFVSGKSQTIYPWETWTKTYTAEPEVWFHDIFRKDGTAFDPKETNYIKSVTARSARK
jgi:hypothetical protein